MTNTFQITKLDYFPEIDALRAVVSCDATEVATVEVTFRDDSTITEVKPIDEHKLQLAPCANNAIFAAHVLLTLDRATTEDDMIASVPDESTLPLALTFA